MVTAHALEEKTRDLIDPLISNREACAISISTSYGTGPDQVFLDSPRAEWLWEYAQDKDILVHTHPPMGSIGDASIKQYRLIEAVGRPFDTALTAARMIYSGVFDRYPKHKVLFVHMSGALEPVVCRLDWNWELGYQGIQNPPIEKVAKTSVSRRNISSPISMWTPWVRARAVSRLRSKCAALTTYCSEPISGRFQSTQRCTSIL